MGVIGAREIETAEQMLSAVYGSTPENAPRQLNNLEVDREAFDQLLSHRLNTLKARYSRAWQAMDPTLEPAINTLLMHFFLCGLVAGRIDARELSV